MHCPLWVFLWLCIALGTRWGWQTVVCWRVCYSSEGMTRPGKPPPQPSRCKTVPWHEGANQGTDSSCLQKKRIALTKLQPPFLYSCCMYFCSLCGRFSGGSIMGRIMGFCQGSLLEYAKFCEFLMKSSFIVSELTYWRTCAYFNNGNDLGIFTIFHNIVTG